jgi:hypothetical protein
MTSPIFYSIYFPVYEMSKTYYSKLIYNNEETLNSKIYTLAATTAAVTANLVTTPMWVVRVRYQTEYMYTKKNLSESFNILKSIHTIYTKEGFMALYRGLLIELIGTPQVIIQFNLYEHFTKLSKSFSKSNSRDVEYKYVLAASVLSKSNL